MSFTQTIPAADIATYHTGEYWLVYRDIAYATTPYDATLDRLLCDAFTPHVYGASIPDHSVDLLVAQTIIRFCIMHDTYVALCDNSDCTYVLYAHNLEYKIYAARTSPDDLDFPGDMEIFSIGETPLDCAQKLITLLQPGYTYGIILNF